MKNFKFYHVFLSVAILSFAVMAQSPWTLQTASGLISTSNPAVTLSAVDENICWGINTINNQYLRTTDGGTNWTVSTITATTGFISSSIAALDANTAWVSMNGGIFKTTDGGLTWAQQLSALPSDRIHFFDSNNGVCVADPSSGYWAIYTTTNGGTNWTRVPSANIPAPLSGEVGISGNDEARSAGNTFWFSTWGGSLYRTTDRGNHWTVARNVIQNQAFGFAFKDSLNGLACTFGSIGNQFISRTSNGGASWTPILPIPSGLSGLTTYYVNYVKGTSGSYIITSNNNSGGTAAIPGSAFSNDDGATWTKNSNIPLGAASFASLNVGWSAGLNTSIYKWVASVLPVELTSFTAHAQDQTVILNWVTATEINNRGFEIQRKVVEGDFATVGFIKGEGTTTNQKEYSYADKNIEDGKYFYRLKQLDFSGEYEYSKTIEVDVRSLYNFTLEQNYPNPFNPSTTIQFQIPKSSFVNLKVYDVLGNEIATLVNEEKSAGNYELEFKPSVGSLQLASGMYLYRLQSGSFVETKKMILLK